jgi:hypothetical protein
MSKSAVSPGRRATSKRAETRVAEYLWGEDAKRVGGLGANDVQGPDAAGNLWKGEVKNHRWPSGPGAVWTLLANALAQAEQHGERAFACYLPKSCEAHCALVMYRVHGQAMVVTLDEFKQRLGLGAQTREASE